MYVRAASTPVDKLIFISHVIVTIVVRMISNAYRSVNGVYMLLISMTDRIRVLAKRNGKIGEKAKVKV